MASASTSKLKILYVMKILREETDAEHGLTMPQIIERLAAYGVSAERKGIYNDIETLREFGINVKTLERSPVEYAIEPDFDLGELMLMVDAIQSCRAITEKQADMLIRNVKTLAANSEQKKLRRRIHVVGRIKSENDSVLGSVDTIHEAMRLHRKVEFSYSKLGADGKRHDTLDGKKHVVTPVGISYDDGFYYLSSWSDSHEGFSEYRLDRMSNVAILEDVPATKNEQISNFKFEERDAAVFGRFVGNEVVATLATPPDKLEIVTDRCGSAVVSMKANAQEVLVRVRVCKSEQFFGWVAGMGKAVRIVGPKSLVAKYREYLEFLLDDERDYPWGCL